MHFLLSYGAIFNALAYYKYEIPDLNLGFPLVTDIL
jgi:hypothetical protein